MYRTGKSYLLNRMLLNRSGGFGVGPTINPCTKVSSRTLTQFDTRPRLNHFVLTFNNDERLYKKIF